MPDCRSLRAFARPALVGVGGLVLVAVAGCASDDTADSLALSSPPSGDLTGAGDPIGQELFTSYLASIGTSPETLATVGDGGE